MQHQTRLIAALSVATMFMLAGCPAEDKQATSSASPTNATTTAPAPSVAVVAGGPDEGRTIFAARCASCHGADGSGAMGPSLKGVGKEHTDAQLAGTIEKGRADKGMPPFGATLKPSEVKAVVAFIKTL